MLRPISATTTKFKRLLCNGSQDTTLPAKIWTKNLEPITKNYFHEIT